MPELFQECATAYRAWLDTFHALYATYALPEYAAYLLVYNTRLRFLDAIALFRITGEYLLSFLATAAGAPKWRADVIMHELPPSLQSKRNLAYFTIRDTADER